MIKDGSAPERLAELSHALSAGLAVPSAPGTAAEMAA
jgi:hypothetical protein